MNWNTSERVHLGDPNTSEESWWGRYESSISGLSVAARAALRVDCRYIVERGIFGSGMPGDPTWLEQRSRTGLVMGAVQSGKTASMLGVGALALDAGVDILVVLAGTRLSLWRQTYERLVSQLDAGPDGVAKSARRILIPTPASTATANGLSLHETYALSSAQIRRKLRSHSPIIVVAMKQTDHLYALGNEIRTAIFPAVKNLSRPVHMLVLDDESDDGSVLDAAVEAGQDLQWNGFKQIPRAIADLWDPQSEESPGSFFSTYIGYTATPQANFLQEDHNPLAPRDFALALRTPLDSGLPIVESEIDAGRSSTYPDPAGLNKYYVGGEIFYRRGASASLCEALTDDPSADLAAAVRAFLVAGAIELAKSAGKFGPATLMGMTFASEEDAARQTPDPHSMLCHPASEINEQFSTAEDILLWAGISDRCSARALIESGAARLPASLIAKMREEVHLWRSWYDKYSLSLKEIASEFSLLGEHSLPSWEAVRNCLETEIIPGTRLSVVNSDPAADTRPIYHPTYNRDDCTWTAALDTSTIFVSGNVMSRGITLEGLTTTLFRRGASVPLADTQMQMQRWFGYRGRHLELCRLFASSSQLDLFAAYHDVDEAMRTALTAAMGKDAPSPHVLHGSNFLATGKISNLGRTPLCPSAKPFVTFMNRNDCPDPNVGILAGVFSAEESTEVVVGGVSRGRALEKAFSLTEAADLLDSLRYRGYRPGGNAEILARWSSLESRIEAVLPLPEPSEFYRAPRPTKDSEPSLSRADCPYSIAAYLRLWDACLTRAVRGLFVTGSPGSLWSMADLHEKGIRQPRFNIGIRYGRGEAINAGPLGELPFRVRATTKMIDDSGTLDNRWGANDPDAGPRDYRGDEYFDFYHRSTPLSWRSEGGGWRPEGSDGQILFYVNQLPGQSFPTVGLGLCIPSGGPEQFSATRSLA